MAFVNQFRPSLRKDVLDTLGRIQLLTRDEIESKLVVAINRFLSRPELAERRSVYVVPLSYNSGAFVRMLLEQRIKSSVERENIVFCKSIREALRRVDDGDAIILCDDNVSSGSQATSQFLRWFGIDREKWPEELRAEGGIEEVELGDNELKLLGKLKVGIAVCVRGQRSEEFVCNTLRSFGIDALVGIDAADILEEDTCLVPHMSENLKRELQLIGESVLHFAMTGRQAKSSELGGTAWATKSLGYDNQGSGLITLYNVPTSTVTALWCPGVYNNEPWTPLFLRRGYLRHVVYA